MTQALYLIRKRGAFYRPNAEGYTMNRAEAGRYTLAEAISHSHPNGPDGPRDGIDYMLAGPDSLVSVPEPRTAAELVEIVNAWLSRDGDWGAWEKALDAICNPEPVPATNQAGEVERLRARLAPYNADTGGNMPTSNDTEILVPLGELRAALATQPATSQEGEV